MRIVFDWFATARWQAWRIHHVAGSGRELVALAPVELLRGAVEADDALLDQVEERNVVPLVALRDRHDEAKVGVDHPLLGSQVAALDALREGDLVGRREQLVPSRGVHEELERVEGAGRGGPGLCGGRSGAHDHVALLERRAEPGHLVVGHLVLVGQRLELPLLDETALGGLLEQALGRHQIVQMARLVQRRAFPWGRAAWTRGL